MKVPPFVKGRCHRVYEVTEGLTPYPLKEIRNYAAFQSLRFSFAAFFSIKEKPIHLKSYL